MKSMRKKVGEDYGELAEIFSAKVEERRYPTYEAPDDLPRLASDTEKLIYAEEIKIVVKQRSELTRNKRLVYNLMWEQLSTSIHTEVQKHEKYKDFHRKDPLTFLKVITELIKTSIRGDDYKKKTEIKKLYYTTHQGLKMDISTYYEEFKNVRQLYKDAKLPDIPEEEAARDFYNGLNRIKYGQMLMLLENRILHYEKTVDAGYQKATSHLDYKL
jgi:hypothetical protein